MDAHGVHDLAQCGEKKIASFFKAGNPALARPKRLRYPDLGKGQLVPQFTQSHLFRDQLGGADLDFFALACRKLLDDFVNVYHHDRFLSLLVVPSERMGQNLQAQLLVQSAEFRLEPVAELNDPFHRDQYDIKLI